MFEELSDWQQQAEGECDRARRRTETNATVGRRVSAPGREDRDGRHAWLTGEGVRFTRQTTHRPRCRPAVAVQ